MIPRGCSPSQGGLTIRGAYSAQAKASTISAALTLLYITAPANKTVTIISAMIGTSGSNTTNQQLEAVWQKIGTLGTPTATATTPTPMENGDAAAGSTVAVTVTASEPAYTGGVIHGHYGFSSLGGYQYCPVPEERLVITGGQSWGLRLLSTPTAADFSTNVTFVEAG